MNHLERAVELLEPFVNGGDATGWHLATEYIQAGDRGSLEHVNQHLRVMANDLEPGVRLHHVREARQLVVGELERGLEA